MTQDVLTAHQRTHHLMVSGCHFPQLISLAVFLSDSVMGDEISSKAKDHELNFSQEWHENRKMEMKKMNGWRGIEKGNGKKEVRDRLKYFVLLFEGEWKQRETGGRDENKWNVWLGENSRDWNKEGWKEGVCTHSSLLSGLAASLLAEPVVAIAYG